MQKKYGKFIAAGVLLTTAVVILGVVTLNDPTVSLIHYTPDQLLTTNTAEFHSKGVQVDGIVLEGSEQFDPTVPELRFKIRDMENTVSVAVVYREGLKPDSFKEGQGVVVDGQYDPHTKTITAVKLMTKCPSKYEANPDTVTARKAEL
ncbi:MAG: cytochrome c maturation protein CcmE [Candidatus Poribacteria bacterium]|nr:cytochrome c maturation protein CcmE [Candidatus Poribacteria bacterium]